MSLKKLEGKTTNLEKNSRRSERKIFDTRCKLENLEYKIEYYEIERKRINIVEYSSEIRYGQEDILKEE